MKEASQLSGLKYDTLKYYCRLGLIPGVGRNQHNRRLFTREHLDWIKTLVLLRNSGFSLAQLQSYTNLCLQGENTLAERCQFLGDKITELKKKRAQLAKSIDALGERQQYYQAVLSGQQTYHHPFVHLPPLKNRE